LVLPAFLHGSRTSSSALVMPPGDFFLLVRSSFQLGFFTAFIFGSTERNIMRMNEYKQELLTQHKRSDQEYCYYCLEPKYENTSCCQENHFGTFKDLDEDAQNDIINAEIEEYETWSKTQ
jgi:hypothetical protein